MIQVYLNKQEKSQINKLNSHLKKLEKDQAKSKVGRNKEIIKIRLEINEIGTKILKSDRRSMKLRVGSWKDKQIWQIFSQIHQEKKGKGPNK